MAIRQKKTEKSFSVDELMLNVASSLIRDFQSNLRDTSFCSDLQRLVAARDVAGIRQLESEVDPTSDICLYKAQYQLLSLLKRYRFQSDLFSDEELVQKAIDGFRQTQTRLADVDLDKLDRISQLVLDRAASYVSDLLGSYDDEEHRSLCRFGRKASVGIPARKASLAERWELPISGSLEQINWFDSEMSQDYAVQEYWNAQKSSDPLRSTYQEICSLKLSLVPKTFKSLRSIMPNSTIGSYMSHGLGEMIRKRLKRKGYDIGTLQQRHRVLACQASLDNLSVTADLSSASDSITDALVKRLFPADWYEILTKSRIKDVSLPDGSLVQSLTFCTMGIGYTFPLQTLVFLALLNAIRSLRTGRKNNRNISVYGDDMIYPSSMHSDVVTLFSGFGFVLNLDKTFHEGDFRESCGGDYYRGVDVRPFQPRNGSANVSPKAYEAVLYKCINGLLMRWTEYEIGGTLLYLTSQIERVTGKCKLVPGDFPDDAGLKCPTLKHWNFLMFVQHVHPKHVGNGVFRFSYLGLKPELREEKRHEPYLWSQLDDRAPYPGLYLDWGHDREPASDIVHAISCVTGTDARVPILITKDKVPIETFRSKISGRRLRRQSTFVTVSHTGRYTRQSGTSCFEDRR